MGLVTRVVPLPDLLDTAVEMAETIARNAPLAVRATRKLAHLGLEMPLDYARRMGAMLIESVWSSEDAVEGARAFAGKATAGMAYALTRCRPEQRDGTSPSPTTRFPRLECAARGTPWRRPVPATGCYEASASFVVLTMAAATLYGSAFDAGRRSSRRPFQPASMVTMGIRMDAPLSAMP